jgi:hypothetical protein
MSQKAKSPDQIKSEIVRALTQARHDGYLLGLAVAERALMEGEDALFALLSTRPRDVSS